MASLDPVNGPLGTRLAAHLLKRTTFGPAKKEIDQFASMTASDAVDLLLQPLPVPAPPIDPKTGASWVNPKPTDANTDENSLIFYCLGWILEQMRNSGTNATEKLTFFLHTNFTTIRSVVAQSTALYYQNQLQRQYAFGNIKELALKMCTDNAMLILLDGNLNESGRPNENFAREFLELYTIGKGTEIGEGDYTTYTEQDIREAARVLSGYKNDIDFTNIDPDTNVATGLVKVNSGGMAFRHDAGVKTFSRAFNNRVIQPSEVINDLATEAAARDELKQLVDMIFEQKATAKNICRKLYRFFVYYLITDDVEQNIIAPLADILYDNNYVLKPVLEKLLKSQHFFDLDNTEQEDNNKGAIIKSPVELVVGTMRFFNIEPPTDYTQKCEVTYTALLTFMEDQGMTFYEPLDVAGYDAYHQEPFYNRSWISANYLARRYEFASLLMKGTDKYSAPTGLLLDVMTWVNDPSNVADPAQPDLIVKALTDYLLPEEISQERYDYFLNDLLLDNLSTINWNNEWNNYKSSGDDTAIRMQLENLLNAILQSPEYQLC